LIVEPTSVGIVMEHEKAMLAETNATNAANTRNAEPANTTRLTCCDSVRQSLKFNRGRLNSPPQSVAMLTE